MNLPSAEEAKRLTTEKSMQVASTAIYEAIDRGATIAKVPTVLDQVTLDRLLALGYAVYRSPKQTIIGWD